MKERIALLFPVAGLSDGRWHRVAVSVSAERLALYVDCSLLESVDWVHQGGAVRADGGLLVIGGAVEGAETPFEGDLGQLSLLMGDPDAARRHCSHHPPRCGRTAPKPPRSPRTHNAMENLLLSSNDLEDLLGDPEDRSPLSSGRRVSRLCSVALEPSVWDRAADQTRRGSGDRSLRPGSGRPGGSVRFKLNPNHWSGFTGFNHVSIWKPTRPRVCH
ncbi:Collagen alpha-1(XI) chain [Liparis tanakae]|uniref:Collagen alpha-1(XI) chain n=1 Tax=Liparis tanakae TaxID=230148 RepID=A0A4Z2IZ04_9TELE|nr:Collagen alpha-1(XI) chain [Liparis tanakae]